MTALHQVLQTDDAALQSVVAEQKTQQLPLNGRNYLQLAQFVPGANEGPTRSMVTSTDTRPATVAVSVNGQSEFENNYMLDGMDNNDRIWALAGVRPSIDAIAEVNIQTGQYSAELGRTSGGVVNVITKSGTNSFHGAAFEFLRNEALDARDYFANKNLPKPVLRLNQFGGSLGGPIIKGKTFFFVDYEGLRQKKANVSILTVPTEQQRNKLDFSGILAGPSLLPLRSVHKR